MKVYKDFGAGIYDSICRNIEKDISITPINKEGSKALAGLAFAWLIFGLGLERVKEIANNQIIMANL